MNTTTQIPDDILLRRAMNRLISLPSDELRLMYDIMAVLTRKPTPRAAAILAEAQRRAAELKNVPREELGRQFMETLEAIRAEAIANGTATDDIEEILKDD